MSVEHIIATYGYYAVALFACIEGEVAILTAGILACQGMLSLPMVMVSAFLGTWTTEQILFFVGRFYGHSLIQKFPKINVKAEKVFEMVRKYDSLYIFSFRFIYGIRNISPLIIGTAMVSPKKYCVLNFIAAVIWSIIIPTIGFLFSKFIKNNVNDMRIYFVIMGAFVVLISSLPYLIHRIKKTKNK